jgi:hypothetical protein
MAWNPSPEVAVARDAARKLGGKMCVVLWITDDDKLGMASFGRTMELCRTAKGLGEHAYETAMKWAEEELV